MAAPAVTPRQAPTGIKLPDGFSSKIAFARDPNIQLWEKQMKPPGIDGGEPIEQTTMHNAEWRTMAMRALKTLKPSTMVCAYDPSCYTALNELVNEAGAVTQHFPDGSSLSYYAGVNDVDFAELVEGTQPEVTITITPTNYDPVNKVEAGPVVTEVAGT